MSESLYITPNLDKAAIYKELLPQIKSLIEGESDLIANLANISSALKETFNWFWVGFYLVKDEELVLGPFQGPIACTRIKYGKGVCGTSWKMGKSIYVPDVNQFPGHIACSSLSVSEIVVPLYDKQGKIYGVLDVDSERFDVLDKTDMSYLEELVAYLQI